MSGIYIPGMDMPKDCPICPLSHWNSGGYFVGCEITERYFSEELMETNCRPQFCPLVPVPDHGDLIDRDALDADLEKQDMTTGEWDAIGFSISEIDNALTDISADRKE